MKTNKVFVQTMIVSSIIGLIILMIMMFIGVKWLLDKEEVAQVQSPEVIEKQESIEEVVFNSNILGIIVEMTQHEITIFDTNKQQYVTATIQPTTRVTNAYDEAMPISELVLGDVVELIYEPQNDELVGISIAEEVWKKSDLKNAQIDRSNRTIKVGNRTYKYTEDTLVLNKQGETVSIHEIGDYDVLTLKGIDQEIYSIQAVGEQGYIEVSNLPFYEGVLELDTTRHITLQDQMQPIPIGEGTHKVVLQMAGYEPVIQEIEVVAGETTVITAEGAQKSYTTIHMQVFNEGVDYQVNVGEETYARGEEIRILSGRYPISVSAQGYETWSSYLILEEEDVIIQVTLVEEIEEELESEEVESEDVEKGVNDYSISISTDPENAKVYIDGIYTGDTPYNTTLEVGEYSITIKKDGYQTYETNILLDNSDNQNNYRYILIPEQ